MAEYNGWRGGRATWLVALWVDNEPAWYDEWRERAHNIWKDSEPGKYEWETKRFIAECNLAESLQEWVEDIVDERVETCGLVADLMSVALAEIDWREIAENWLSEMREETKENG